MINRLILALCAAIRFDRSALAHDTVRWKQTAAAANIKLE